MHIVVTTAKKNPATNHHWWRENICLQLQLRYFSYFWFTWIFAETRSHAKDMNSSRARAYRHQPRKHMYHHTSMMIKSIHMCLFVYLSVPRSWCDSKCRFSSMYADAVIGSPILYSHKWHPDSCSSKITQNSHDWRFETSTTTTNTHERPYQCFFGPKNLLFFVQKSLLNIYV